MCGIVGVFGNLTITEKRMFQQLHLLDIVRGNDSSGIVRVDDDYNVSTIKAVGTPDQLLVIDDLGRDTEGYVPFFNYKSGLVNGNTHLLIGHNRKATVGGVNLRACHPFEFDNIVGVHNGTIPQYVYSRMEYYKESINDSEALYWEINKYGVETTYKKHNGAFACVAWDKTTSQLKLWRNAQRPMTVKLRKDKTSLMFASEPWMMDLVVNNNRAAIDEWEPDHLIVPIDNLFSVYTNREGVVVWDKTPLEAPSATTTFHYPANQGRSTTALTHFKGGTQTTQTTGSKETVVVRSVFAGPEKSKNTIYNVAVDENNWWWLDPKDNKFHFCSNYHITEDTVDGLCYRYIAGSTTPHRYYEPVTLVSKLFDGLEDDLDPPEEQAKLFANAQRGTRPVDHWLEVTFDKQGKPIFYPPEAKGKPYLIVNGLEKYVIWRENKWYLTQDYTITTPEEPKKEVEKVFFGPFGEALSEDEIELAVLNARGCKYCDSFPNPDEYSSLKWDDNLTDPCFTCSSCQAQEAYFGHAHHTFH